MAAVASVKEYFDTLNQRFVASASKGLNAVFQFELPANSLKPGLYTCQVNIIDEVARRFVFPRLELYVR